MVSTSESSMVTDETKTTHLMAGKEPQSTSGYQQYFPSQTTHTQANMFPETALEAEADLEKGGRAEKPAPASGGIDSASFPDGGLEA